MFSLASGIYQSYFAPPKLSILIVGLDSSGKTSLLERIKVTQIDTKLDISSASSSASHRHDHQSQLETLKLYYSKGAVAMTPHTASSPSSGKEGGAIDDEEDSNSVKRFGFSKIHVGGKPARLPPPLPTRKAAKSREWTEEILKLSSGDCVDGDLNVDTLHSTTETKDAQELLDQVPPLPLIDDGDGLPAAVKVQLDTQKNKAASEKRPPMTKRGTRTTQASEKAPRRSFIEFLRCPSPQSYSNAGLDNDDDEIVEDENDTSVVAESLNAATPALENANSHSPLERQEKEEVQIVDSIDHLSNYFIDYQDGEEFDLIPNNNLKGKKFAKMFPLDKIRPTLGQNLAKLDLSGCKCSLFDLSGAEKMRPLWERYYGDTDAIIYVVDSAETSFANLLQSRREFEKMCNNTVLKERIECGLPILIFANKLDMAYREYDLSVERFNKVDTVSLVKNWKNDDYERGISWNPDEEDSFVGDAPKEKETVNESDVGIDDISKRVIDFADLVALFGLHSLFPRSTSIAKDPTKNTPLETFVDNIAPVRGNVFLFGGSAKSGEGVRAAMEYLIAHSKCFHLGKQHR
mmetsp:Transcript_25833/g.53568  ORF Transcript_25833/g.53568 Transcript_25833/m.53568 type:complete len:576 (-) Transcript_25833:79-1806(-)